MKFLIKNFVHDMRKYGWSTAQFNVRFLIGTGIARSIIREPMFFHVHTDECDMIGVEH